MILTSFIYYINTGYKKFTILLCVNFIMSHRGILIVFVGMCSVLCFAKQNFEISIERVELQDVDTEIIKLESKISTMYNRTCKAFSLNYTVLKAMGYDLDVEVQVFALYSNEYRRTPVNFKRNACDILKMEFLWFKSEIEKYSHFPTQCPLVTGDYYVKDFVPNGADFPAAANFPWKNCMFWLRFVYKDKTIVIFKMYLTFDHDAELKRLG